MLNRRFLRVKVFQTLFALEYQRVANQEQTSKTLANFFHSQKTAKGFEHSEEIKNEELIALDFLEKTLKEGLDSTPNLSSKTAAYISKLKSDLKLKNERVVWTARKNLIANYKLLLTSYHRLFIFFKQFARDITYLSTKTYQYSQAKTFYESLQNFGKQGFINYIRENAELENYENNHPYHFESELNGRVLNYLRDLRSFQDFLAESNTSLAVSMVKVFPVFHDLLRSKSPLYEHFQKHDLYWQQNVKALISLLKMQLNSKNTNTIFELKPEPDLAFINLLFEKTLLEEKERLASIAKFSHRNLKFLGCSNFILIMLGMTEILHCENIPFKVTLNEYIAIAKSYSDPGTVGFINRILDRFVKEQGAADKFLQNAREVPASS